MLPKAERIDFVANSRRLWQYGWPQSLPSSPAKVHLVHMIIQRWQDCWAMTVFTHRASGSRDPPLFRMLCVQPYCHNLGSWLQNRFFQPLATLLQWSRMLVHKNLIHFQTVRQKAIHMTQTCSLGSMAAVAGLGWAAWAWRAASWLIWFSWLMLTDPGFSGWVSPAVIQKYVLYAIYNIIPVFYGGTYIQDLTLLSMYGFIFSTRAILFNFEGVESKTSPTPAPRFSLTTSIKRSVLFQWLPYTLEKIFTCNLCKEAIGK